ncbi:MAG: FtsX-like permease family protein [Lachnospiraceae bacterium]|nr:FtsX-like permease family protein [Lachnospiraceae bacterium]
MNGKLIWNDINGHKLHSGAMLFFMTISAMLLALTVILSVGLLGAIDDLMDKAQVPDYIQMHNASLLESEKEEISRFASQCGEVTAWQVCPFLNLDNSQVMIGGKCLADSTQDNGLVLQGEQFDFLLDTENNIPEALPGEIYVPVCYRSLYDLSAGDRMTFGDWEFEIAGFLRDAQMNSMMASSKRFLIHEADFERIREEAGSGSAPSDGLGLYREEYLIEFMLKDQVDVNAFGTAYGAADLPAQGPAITRPLIRMMNGLSDGTMIAVLFLISMVVLLISILCIRFMVSLQMERDRKEVGMLKALGIGRRQIRQIYLAKYVLFCGLGAFIGLLFSFALKVPLAKQVQELYGAAQGGAKAVFLAILSVLFTEGIILCSIRRFLKKTEQMPALEALFSMQEKKTGKGQYLVIGGVAAFCVFLALVPQNLYSTMSDPEFVTYMGIGKSMIRMDLRQTEKAGSYGDVDLAVGQIAAALEQDTQVEKYVTLRTVSGMAVLPEGKTVNLTLETGDHGIFPVSYSKGRLPQGEGEIALSAMNAKELGLDLGDKLQLWGSAKEDGAVKTDYIVCGIYSDITNGGKTAKVRSIDSHEPAIWSVLYVSLKDPAQKGQWLAGYRKMGAEVTDIEDYVKHTYGQTLGQLHKASLTALVAGVFVLIVVTMLFVRLIVEQDRYEVSFYKALGFTGRVLKRKYLIKGMLPVIAGIGAGLLAGNLLGEGICGMILQSFGADSFRFVIHPVKALLLTPALLLAVAAAGVWMGIRELKKIGACECCMGKE